MEITSVMPVETAPTTSVMPVEAVTTTTSVMPVVDLVECTDPGEHGCCPSSGLPAHGPSGLGCCAAGEFGCCPDNETPAEGPYGEGCDCR